MYYNKHIKQKALSGIKLYMKKQGSKIDNIRKAKRHYYLSQLNNKFQKLKKNVSIKQKKKQKLLLAIEYYNRLLLNKCWTHFMAHKNIAEIKKDKQEKQLRVFNKKRMKAVFERLSYHYYKKKSNKNRISKIKSKQNKEIQVKVLNKLKLYAKNHKEKRIKLEEKIREKTQALSRTILKIYWLKLIEYHKTKQIKK